MSLGVLNNIAAIYAQNNLNQTQNSLQNVLQQLSSGSRINSGADDAAGLALADGLHANEAALNQSSQNATAGVGLLQTADGALSQVTNLLNRAVTLATEAANGTLNSSQIGSANQEYQNILTEIGDIGSTTNFNGNSVFSNTAKTVFVSDGTASGATTYSETIGALSAGSVGTTAATAGVATALANPGATAGTGSAVTFPGTPTTAAAAGVGEVDTLTLGAATDSLSGTLSVAVAGGTAISVSLAAGTSIADAVTALNGDAGFSGAGLVAAQGTGANSNTITITGPTGAANTLDLTGSSLTDTTAAGNTPVTGSGTYTLTNASDSVSGTLSVAVNGGTAVTATLAAGTSLADAVTQLNANTAFSGAGLTASVGTGANANQLIIKGGATDTLDMSGSTLSDTAAAVAGPGVDFTGAASSLTAANATSVLTSVTSAIQDIDYQRGNIGASINELNAASNVASAESVNLTSAEDSVRSTNYGQATSNMASLQVLSQTGISALAQANSVQQEILKLMQ